MELYIKCNMLNIVYRNKKGYFQIIGMFWTLFSNIKDFQNRRFLLQMANMYYVSESVDLNHSSLNLVRHTTFNLASCLISSCYWL